MSDNEDVLAAGALFGNYQIVRVLGQGAFGVVYEALRQPLGKRTALKVLRKQLVSHPEVLQRFLREAQTTAQIQHPHIVETFDIGEVQGAPYLAMEFLEGEALSRKLKREKKLPVQTAVDVMLAVLSAMAAVHDRGIIHRDLKPENIHLARGRGHTLHPKVLDFGIAKVSGHESEMALTRTSALLGTPYYMSPEQAKESKHINARSDQWALGVILYECVTGQRPFTGGSLLELLNRIAAVEYTPPTQLVPEIPQGVESVIARTLQRDPEHRFADVRAMALALLPFASDGARAIFTEDFAGERGSTPSPGMDIQDTTELPDFMETAAAPSGASGLPSASGGAVSGLGAFASRSSPNVVLNTSSGEGVIARTAAMTSPPLPAAGGTLTLSPRESTTPATPSPSKRVVPIAVAAVLAVAAIGSWVAVRGPTPSATPAHAATTLPERFRIITRAMPATAAIVLDREAPVVGAIDRELPRDGRIHRIIVTAPGYRSAEFSFRDHFASPEIELVREEAPAAPPAPTPAPVVTAPPPATALPAVAEAPLARRGRRRRDADGGTTAQPDTHAPSAETGSNGVAIR